MTKSTPNPGFSAVEVIIGLLILSLAILAMGASTSRAMAQIQASEFRTERMEAVRKASESLRASASTPVGWANLADECATDPYVSTGSFDVTCVVSAAGEVTRVTLITDGPAFIDGSFRQSVRDSLFSISLAKPVK